MTEINTKIIDMITKEATATEIAHAVGMTNNKLYYRISQLRSMGYNIKTKYYYNGDIVYKIVKDIIEPSDEYTILTSKKDTKFKALLISDLHLCNNKCRPDLLDAIYNYCIKEGINIIIHAGDFIDGIIGQNEKNFYTPEEPIDYAINVYPKDSNIITFTVLGNHDYNLLEEFGFDIAGSLKNRRHDIVPIGYGLGIINVKNDQIIVKHPRTLHKNRDISLDKKLVVIGHYHQFAINSNGGNIYIKLPSFSDMKITGNEILPGAVKANINFHNGFFCDSVFEHLLVSKERIYKVGEFQCDLSVGKKVETNVIKNEQEKDFLDSLGEKEEKGKVLTYKNKTSQIDKFNKKYNNR